MKMILLMLVLLSTSLFAYQGGTLNISDNIPNSVKKGIEPFSKAVVVNLSISNLDLFEVKTVRRSGSEYNMTTDVNTDYKQSITNYFKQYRELKQNIFSESSDTITFDVVVSPIVFKQHDVSKKGQKFLLVAGGQGTLAYDCRMTGSATISFTYNGKEYKRVIELSGGATVESSTGTIESTTPQQQLLNNMKYMFESSYESIIFEIEKVLRQMSN